MSSLTLSLEFRLWYASVVLGAVGYSIFLLVTIVSLWLLWRARQNAETFGRRALLPYTVVLFSLGTIVFVVTMWLMQFALELTADGQHLLGSTGQCQGFAMADLLTQVAIFMNDMLLMYRTFVIAQKKFRLVALPAVLILAQVVFATMTDWRSADPQGSLSGMNNGHLTLAWLISSVAFNVLVTTTIAIKLWPARADTHKGGQRASSAIDILVESAAAYTVTGVLLIVSRAVESDYAIVFNQLFGIMAFLSSSIITLRIAMGIEYIPPDGSAMHPSLLPTTMDHCSISIAGDIIKTH